MSNMIDMSGKKYGRLTALKRVGTTKGRDAIWLFKCDCGKEVAIRGSDVRFGKTKSCGCYNADVQRKLHTTHGMSSHPVYFVWSAMRDRCRNKNSTYYYNYGGRGIEVCDRWLDSFENFWEDMQEGYQEGLTLDRVDNNGNYEPDNCKWSSRYEQMNNSRRNRLLTLEGKTQSMALWARELNMNYNVLRGRVNRGLL